jgi:hypothetical protein
MAETRILRVSNVELPLDVLPVPESPEVQAAIKKFTEGQELSPEEKELLISPAVRRAGNGNCNVC